jgi:RNA polymerase sigma factor (sigma-70 family)
MTDDNDRKAGPGTEGAVPGGRSAGLDELADRFEQNRSRLRAVAQRMLGTPHEAEDAVQEAWLRLSRADTGEVGNLAGWLTTVVSRVCLDMLRSRAARREDIAEVPETLVSDEPQPESQALVADAIGPALLVVLDTLRPGERLAFVLHDMFAVPFPEIAGIVGCSPAAARQLASRGRRKVQGVASRDDNGDESTETAPDDAVRRRTVVSAFMAASRGGDFAALLALLHPEAVLRVDNAAVKMGSIPAVQGAAAVAESLSGKARAVLLTLIDGAPGAVWSLRGVPQVAFVFTIGDDALISAIDLVADPEVLAATTFERFPR